MDTLQRQDAKMAVNAAMAHGDHEFFIWLLHQVHTEAALYGIPMSCGAAGAIFEKPEDDVVTVSKTKATVKDPAAAEKLSEVAKNAMYGITAASKSFKGKWMATMLTPKCKKKAYNEVSYHLPKNGHVLYNKGGMWYAEGWIKAFTKKTVKLIDATGKELSVPYEQVALVDMDTHPGKVK